jgi:ribosomal peptide maturation radical SAM protein 1
MADNILSTGYHKTFVEWARDRELDLDLFYEIKANMSREQVRHLAEAGIRMVQPGIEHFSSEVLTLMRKGVKGIQNVAFLKYAAENGVITIYSILAGFPGEDPNAYGRMAGQLGKLAHLKPPSAVIDIEFHRFSPYHNTPEAFGVKLRPHKKYEMIFPLPERELARLAYQFVVAGRRIRDLAYISGVSRIVNQWRDSYRSDVCTLTWGWDGDDIVVEDRRMGFPERNYRMSGHAVHALLAMETPQRLSNIVSKARASADAGTRAGNGNGGYRKNGTEEASVSFSREAFEADPLGSLAPLIDAGLFWQEDDSFINLAVVNTHEATTRKWIDVQVP